MPRGHKYPEEMREEARRLRREGWSLGEISKRLGPPKNTLTLWVRDIELTPEQQARIKEREAQTLTRNTNPQPLRSGLGSPLRILDETYRHPASNTLNS